jgi:hypothetical protein
MEIHIIQAEEKGLFVTANAFPNNKKEDNTSRTTNARDLKNCVLTQHLY